MDYLSEAGLQSIKHHQYVPGCYTPLDNLLNPWWFWATERLPMWMAPNLVTLIGTMHLGAIYVLIWRTEDQPEPWLMGVCAWCLFVYQTLDAMDGKQARRTGNSSPLGQLFDHGCDALGLLTFLSAITAVLGLDPTSRWAFAVQASSQTIFFLAQWTEFHTHVLPTALGPIGVTEIQYSLIVGSLLSCFLREPVNALLVGPAMDDSALPMNLAIAVMLVLANILSCLAFILAVVNASETTNPTSAMLQLVTVLAVAVGSVFGFSEAAYTGHFRELSLATGLLLTHLTNKMIVFSMANQEFGGFLQQWIVLPYFAVMVATDSLDAEQLSLAIMGLLGAMVANYVGWCGPTILHISTTLEINIFRITPKKDKKA